MTYNVFSGTLNPTHFTSLQLTHHLFALAIRFLFFSLLQFRATAVVKLAFYHT